MIEVLNDTNFSLRVEQDRKNERKRVKKDAQKQIQNISLEIREIEVRKEKQIGEIVAGQDAEVAKVKALGKYALLLH